jgi:hypothetical protein
VDFTLSNHRARGKQWRQSQSLEKQTIRELFLEDFKIQQEKNHLMGKKIDQLVDKVNLLKEQASSIYDSPSVRLSQSPILNILLKTIATYMFLKNPNHPQENIQP